MKAKVKVPIKAFHKTCGYEWVFAWLPMPLISFNKLKKNTLCPKCGDKKDIYMEIT